MGLGMWEIQCRKAAICGWLFNLVITHLWIFMVVLGMVSDGTIGFTSLHYCSPSFAGHGGMETYLQALGG